MSFSVLRNRYLPLLLLAAVVVSAYAAGLFVDVTRDASKYAVIARGIFETGDFIHLKVEGDPYLQKPPLLFWISALSYSVFGINNFAFKFPVLVFTFLGFYSIYRLGKSMFGRKAGILAAMLLSTTVISFLYNMDIHTDTLMQSFVSFSLWQFYDFLKTRRMLNWFLGFAGTGLAMLTKGPVGAMVPAFAVTGYILFSGQYRKLLDYRWYAGILISLACILPALAGLYHQFGWEGIKFFFWSNNAGRLAGAFSASDRGILYFAYNLLFFFLPWTFFLLVSLFFEFRRLIRKKFRPEDWFIFSGTWFYFIIISLSGSKLPHYIYVLIPLLSLTTARYLILAVPARNREFFIFLRKIQHPILFIFLTLSGLLVFWLYPPDHIWQWMLSVLMIFIAILLYSATDHSPLSNLIFPSLTLAVSFCFIVNQHAAPQIFSDQASVKAADYFNRYAGKEDQLFNYNYYSYELNFYSDKEVLRVKDDVTLWELMKKPGNWVLTTGEVIRRIPPDKCPDPVKIPLTHVWMNKLSVKYLLPATRDASYDTLFLIRSAVPAYRY